MFRRRCDSTGDGLFDVDVFFTPILVVLDIKSDSGVIDDFSR